MTGYPSLSESQQYASSARRSVNQHEKDEIEVLHSLRNIHGRTNDAVFAEELFHLFDLNGKVNYILHILHTGFVRDLENLESLEI